MFISLIINEGKYGNIDADDTKCHGYYIIKFYSSTYTLQPDLIIDDKVIFSGEVLREVTFLININSHYYALQNNKSNNTIVSLRTILNVNLNIKCYDLKDDVPYCLQYIFT